MAAGNTNTVLQVLTVMLIVRWLGLCCLISLVGGLYSQPVPVDDAASSVLTDWSAAALFGGVVLYPLLLRVYALKVTHCTPACIQAVTSGLSCQGCLSYVSFLVMLARCLQPSAVSVTACTGSALDTTASLFALLSTFHFSFTDLHLLADWEDQSCHCLEWLPDDLINSCTGSSAGVI